MGDMGELFRAMKQDGAAKRARNRENSIILLEDEEIPYEKLSDAHFRVKLGDKTADFWPGTGKFIIRGEKKYRRGVFNLIREMKKDLE